MNSGDLTLLLDRLLAQTNDLGRRNLNEPERKGPGALWRLVPQK
jgi:hypothetical protein